MLNLSTLQLAAVDYGRVVHDLSPFLVKFTPTFGIRYYGLSYAAWVYLRVSIPPALE